MWSIALLINTSMWNEFKNNWKLICLVFLQLHFGDDHMKEQYQDALLEKISKIKSDPNVMQGIKFTEKTEEDEGEESEGCHKDCYDFQDDTDVDKANGTLGRSKIKKVN